MRTTLISAAIVGLGLASMLSAETTPSKGGEPYPNDSGPTTIDVSKYPEEMQETYKVFTTKCAACHTVARPINSQFLELSAEEQAKAKKDEPYLFADKKLYQVEDGIWKRYVKRMMSKPGCSVTAADGKKIWALMVYDSKVRKTGKNAAAWQAHRKKLLNEFAKANPARYKALFSQ